MIHCLQSPDVPGWRRATHEGGITIEKRGANSRPEVRDEIIRILQYPTEQVSKPSSGQANRFSARRFRASSGHGRVVRAVVGERCGSRSPTSCNNSMALRLHWAVLLVETKGISSIGAGTSAL